MTELTLVIALVIAALLLCLNLYGWRDGLKVFGRAMLLIALVSLAVST